MDIYINTINKNKIEEIKFIFKTKKKFRLHFLNRNIREILSNDIESVIKQKAIDAYLYWKTPVIVEHGALEIKYFNNFPGALAKPMWDLMKDKICKLIPINESRNATVTSAVCYCDGKQIKSFFGKTTGIISEKGLGSNGFQFDPIFIPEGSEHTYAEMDLNEKMKYSQATKSYSGLIDYLEKN